MLSAAALTSLAVAVLGADPPRPSFPNQFTASIIYDGGYTHGSANGTLYYDGVAQMQHTLMGATKLPWSPFAWNTSTYVTRGAYYFDTNDVCRLIVNESKWNGMWDWLAGASYEGKATVRNQLCDVWALRSEYYNSTVWAVGNTPVQLNQSYYGGGLPGQGAQYSKSVMEFITITPGAPPRDAVSPPDSCFTKPQPCDADPAGRVQIVDHFIAHPRGVYNISNQDTADAMGDTAFTCADVLSGNTQNDGYAVVSRYNIAVDTRWGEYALCNGYPGQCIGSETFYVGREASYGAKPKGGQCDNNTDYGSWFSFPNAGRCESRADLDAGKCTWYVVERIKTVNLTCPFATHGMLEACKAAQGPEGLQKPFAIFQAAFASESTAEGGCPDIGGPPR